MKPQTKSAINELIQKGYEVNHIMIKLQLDESCMITIANMYNKHHVKELNSKVTSLQQELSRRKSFEVELRKQQEENRVLKQKIKSMEGTLDSVNRLSAERSKLIRKLKKAGVKI